MDNTPILQATKKSSTVSSLTISEENSNSENSTDNSSNLNSSNSSKHDSIVRENSIYENHEILRNLDNFNIFERNANRPTQSVILQFDPLSKTENKEPNQDAHNLEETVENYEPWLAQNTDHMKELEQLLQGDLFLNTSQAGTYDNWSVSNDSEEPDDYMNPPTPPTRYDSLPDDIPSTPKESKTSWFTNDEVKPSSNGGSSNKQLNNPTESKKVNWLKQVNVVLKKAPDIVRGSKSKESLLQRPALVPKYVAHQKGMLYKVTNRPVEDFFGEFSARWCVLNGMSFTCYSDNTCDVSKECFQMQNILSLQILTDHKFKYKYENEELHCFEINTSGRSRGGFVYGSRSILETKVWMQRLAESLTNRFSSQILSEYTRLGWAYVREGNQILKKKVLYIITLCIIIIYS